MARSSMRLRAGVASAVLAAAIGACSVCAADNAPASGPEATTVLAPASPPTETSGNMTRRVLDNFLTLLARNWPGILSFVGWTAVSMAAWAAGLGLAGLLAGLLLWKILRRWKSFDAPWPWYGKVRWLWCVLFMLSFTLGAGYAGLHVGLERGLKRAIRRDLLLDRVAISLYQAIALDRADYRATGQETPKQLYRIVADTEAVGRLALDDYEAFKEALIVKEGHSFGRRIVLRLVADYVLPRISMRGVDYKALVKFIFSEINYEEYVKAHPEANPGLLLFGERMENMRDAACRGVEMMTRGGIYAGLALGAGVPVGLLAVFRLLLFWLARRAQASGAA